MENVNVEHCKTYYEINIWQEEYGDINLWKRKMSYTRNQNQTVKRISFVYSCDTVKGDLIGKQGLCKAIKFFFLSMKKRQFNPMGPLVVDYLKEQNPGLFKYLLRKNNFNEDSIGEKLTEDINKQYRGDYNIIWDDYLNHWMVDYDIIRILKWHVQYTSWAAVPIKTKQLCYKRYHGNFTLPDWDKNQEKY
jgi:hypothetical protein